MVDAHKESCLTKTALISAWQIATEAYSKAVGELSSSIGIIPKAEYEKLSNRTEAARRRAMEAKANLDNHVSHHGCDGNDGEAAA
jgi:hypothetical protein